MWGGEEGEPFFLGVRVRMFPVTDAGLLEIQSLLSSPSLSIQMPFHIRKLESALLMQDLLALLSNSTEE